MSRPRTVPLTIGLVILNGLIWLIYAGLVLFSDLNALPSLKMVFAGLAFTTAVFLFFFASGLRQRNRLAYIGAILLLVLIALLSITDEVGLADWLSLAVSAIPVVLLLKDRRWYQTDK